MATDTTELQRDLELARNEVNTRFSHIQDFEFLQDLEATRNRETLVPQDSPGNLSGLTRDIANFSIGTAQTSGRFFLNVPATILGGLGAVSDWIFDSEGNLTSAAKTMFDWDQSYSNVIYEADKYVSGTNPTLRDRITRGSGTSAGYMLGGFGLSKFLQGLGYFTPTIANMLGFGLSHILEAVSEAGNAASDNYARDKSRYYDALKSAGYNFLANAPTDAVLNVLEGALMPTKMPLTPMGYIKLGAREMFAQQANELLQETKQHIVENASTRTFESGDMSFSNFLANLGDESTHAHEYFTELAPEVIGSTALTTVLSWLTRGAINMSTRQGRRNLRMRHLSGQLGGFIGDKEFNVTDSDGNQLLDKDDKPVKRTIKDWWYLTDQNLDLRDDSNPETLSKRQKVLELYNLLTEERNELQDELRNSHAEQGDKAALDKINSIKSQISSLNNEIVKLLDSAKIGANEESVAELIDKSKDLQFLIDIFDSPELSDIQAKIDDIQDALHDPTIAYNPDLINQLRELKAKKREIYLQQIAELQSPKNEIDSKLANFFNGTGYNSDIARLFDNPAPVEPAPAPAQDTQPDNNIELDSEFDEINNPKQDTNTDTQEDSLDDLMSQRAALAEQIKEFMNAHTDEEIAANPELQSLFDSMRATLMDLENDINSKREQDDSIGRANVLGAMGRNLDNSGLNQNNNQANSNDDFNVDDFIATNPTSNRVRRKLNSLIRQRNELLMLLNSADSFSLPEATSRLNAILPRINALNKQISRLQDYLSKKSGNQSQNQNQDANLITPMSDKTQAQDKNTQTQNNGQEQQNSYGQLTEKANIYAEIEREQEALRTAKKHLDNIRSLANMLKGSNDFSIDEDGEINLYPYSGRKGKLQTDLNHQRSMLNSAKAANNEAEINARQAKITELEKEMADLVEADEYTQGLQNINYLTDKNAYEAEHGPGTFMSREEYDKLHPLSSYQEAAHKARTAKRQKTSQDSDADLVTPMSDNDNKPMDKESDPNLFRREPSPGRPEADLLALRNGLTDEEFQELKDIINNAKHGKTSESNKRFRELFAKVHDRLLLDDDGNPIKPAKHIKKKSKKSDKKSKSEKQTKREKPKSTRELEEEAIKRATQNQDSDIIVDDEPDSKLDEINPDDDMSLDNVERIVTEEIDNRDKDETPERYNQSVPNTDNNDLTVGKINFNTSSKKYSLIVVAKNNSNNTQISRLRGRAIELRNSQGDVIATYYPYTDYFEFHYTGVNHSQAWLDSFEAQFRRYLPAILKKANFLDKSGNLRPDGNEELRRKNTNKGKVVNIRTIQGTEVQARYRIVEADDLIVSTLETGAHNPAYPQNLQPRQRDREASKRQIADMAAKIDPELLAENRLASDGAPVIGSDSVVESGNGRTMALKLAYRTNSANKYKSWLRKNAQRFGFSASYVNQFKNPVLVRERISEVDRVKFTAEANDSSVARMSTFETAMNDAKRISDSMLLLYDTDKSLAANHDFINAFLKSVPDSERGAFLQKNGNISKAGLLRIENALIAKAYNDTSIVNRLSESTDDTIKNVLNALTNAAPKIAALEGSGVNHDLSIGHDIMQAVNLLLQIKDTGSTVETELAQIGFNFDNEEQTTTAAKRLLKAFDRNKRSAKRIANILIRYAELASQEAKKNQNTFTGMEDSNRSKDDILKQAIREGENGDSESYKQSDNKKADISKQQDKPKNIISRAIDKVQEKYNAVKKKINQAKDSIARKLDFATLGIRDFFDRTENVKEIKALREKIYKKLRKLNHPALSPEIIKPLSHLIARISTRFAKYAGVSPEEFFNLDITYNDDPNAIFDKETGGIKRGSIDFSKNLLELLNTSDVSTVIHEAGHFFLNSFRTLLRAGKLKGVALQDWQTLTKWLGISDLDLTKNYNQQSEEGKRWTDAHEKFAVAFEKYTREGKAPTKKLKRAFEAFKRWLYSVYDSFRAMTYRGSDCYDYGFRLNDDIRRVFDNMFTDIDGRSDNTDMRTDTKADNSSSEREHYNQIIGEEAARRLDEAEKSYWRISWLNFAKKLERNGVDSKKIWLSTNWQRGTDGEWRFEIPYEKFIGVDKRILDRFHKLQDKDMTSGLSSDEQKLYDFLEARAYNPKLSLIFDAPELYRAYPQLKQLHVGLLPDDIAGIIIPGADGAFVTSKIINDDHSISNIFLRTSLPKRKIQENLIHEIQHAIQRLENWAIGDSGEENEEVRAKIMRQINKASSESIPILKNLLKNMQNGNYKKVLSVYNSLEYQDKVIATSVIRDFKKLIETRNYYLSSAGETEARNAARRSSMSEYKKRDTSLSETEDVPRQKQRVVFAQDDDDVEGNPYYTDNNNEHLNQTAHENNFLTPDMLERYNQTAYTGTGNIIWNNKWDLNYAGSNEGSAVFGYGAYAAQNREVPEEYRRFGLPNGGIGTLTITTNDGKTFVSGKNGNWADISQNKEAAERVFSDIHKLLAKNNKLSFDNIKDSLTKKYRKWLSNGEEILNDKDRDTSLDKILTEQISMLKDTIQLIHSISDAKLENLKQGNVYELDIPEDHELLDWDAKLTEQPEKVKEAIKKIYHYLSRKGYSRNELVNEFSENGVIETGEDLYWAITNAMKDYLLRYPNPSDNITDPKARASFLFNKFGIPGHRYWDAYSRDAKAGTHNFVIWNASRIKLTGITEDSDDDAKRIFNDGGRRQLEFLNDNNSEHYNQIIGEKGARKLDEAEGTTTRMDNLKIAKQMEQQALPEEKIWLATGWQKGVDDKWRYEILDGKLNEDLFDKRSVLREFIGEEDKEYLLPEIYSNNVLYNAYPKLKETKVSFIKEGMMYYSARYSLDENKISCNLDKNSYEKSIFEVLIHEIQHAIQSFEGFANGANYMSVWGDPHHKKHTEKLYNKYYEIFSSFEPMSFESFIKHSFGKVNSKSKAAYKKYVKDFYKERKYNAARNAQEYSTEESYRSTAGEVEARNASKRSLMNAEERKNTPLSDTEDFRREDQFVENYHQSARSADNLDIAQEQLDAVRKKYIGTDQWMKAPNGKDTNLTEKQWLQVRTPNFKRWFGNWNYDENAHVSVTEIDSANLPFDYKDTKSVKQWLHDNLTGREVTINSNGAIIGFTNRGLNASLKGRGEQQRSTYAALDKVIQNAVFFDFQNVDDKKKHEHLKGQDIYYSAIKINDTIYPVKISIDINRDTLQATYKGHKTITDITITPAVFMAETVNGVPSQSGVDISIGELTNHVKPENISKVVDENGEPRVVYHGTNKDFSIFDIRHLGSHSGDLGFFGEGFYFAFTEDEASYYDDKRIIPAFINLKNPFIFTEELLSYNGERDFYATSEDVIFALNYLDKFPELAENHSVYITDYGTNEKKWVTFKELAAEVKNILDNKEFTVIEIKDDIHAWNDKVFLVCADPVEKTYEDSNGSIQKYTDYEYEERYDTKKAAENKIQRAIFYMLHGKGLDMASPHRIIMGDDFKSALIKRGYDGVMQSKDGDEVVAFNPEQIKSATENNGNFDGNNPNIYHQTAQNTDTLYIAHEQLDAVRKQYEGTDKWLKAPNGKKSFLTELQWLQVRTPNFKRWFGDWENDPQNASKILDANGEPLVLYHATNAYKIKKFKKGKYGYLGPGIYFSEDKNYIKRYTDYGDEGIMHVFLNLRNPFIVKTTKPGLEILSAIYGEKATKLFNKRTAKYDGGFQDSQLFAVTNADINKLNELGYDGIFWDYPGGKEWAVTDSTQIKSATDNNDNFDNNDPDIYHQAAQNPLVKSHTFENTDSEQAYSKARKGDKPTTTIAKLNHYIGEIMHGFRGDFPDLATKEAKKAGLIHAREILRKMNREASTQIQKAANSIAASIKSLNPEQFNIFGRFMLLYDLKKFRDTNKDTPLPLGFTDESLNAEYDKFLNLAKQDSTIVQAINSEQREHIRIRKQLVALAQELGMKKFASKAHYYDTFLLDIARQINGEDINANYIQRVGEVRTTLLQDIARLEAIKELRSKYDKKQELMQQYGKDWIKHIPEGYRIFNPLQSSFITSDKTFTENAMNAVIEKLGLQMGLTEGTMDNIRKKLSDNSSSHLMVLPEALANTLNKIAIPKTRGPLGKFFKLATTLWKKSALYFPTRTVKYNFRNLTGDLDVVFAGNPSGLLQLKRAITDLWHYYYRNRDKVSSELSEFQKRGGAITIESTQELYDYKEMREFNHLISKLDWQDEASLKKIPRKVWNWLDKYLGSGIVKLTDYREQWLRYAMYLDYLQQMQKNPDGMPNNFGASVRDEVMSLPDIRDRAFKLANELIGAYDQVSETGKALRDMAIPFYSWLEVNAKRYMQLFKNGLSDNPHEFVGNFLKGQLFNVPYYGWKLGKTYFMIQLFSMLVKAFNNFVFPDDEDKLPPDIQDRLHITLGHDTQGNVLYFDRVGALLDNREWFGQDSTFFPFKKDVKDIFDGRQTFLDLASKVTSSAFSKAVGSLNPIAKWPIEIGSGRTFYPNAARPRIIRDTWQYIAQALGLQWPYKAAKNAVIGAPYSGWDEFKNLFLYKADAEQAAYFYTLNKVHEFHERVLGRRFDGFATTQRGEVLRDLRTALRYDDKDAIRRNIEKYGSLGGKGQGLKTSLRNMHPLHSMNKREQQQFMQWLSPEDRKFYNRAVKYFEEIVSRL